MQQMKILLILLIANQSILHSQCKDLDIGVFETLEVETKVKSTVLKSRKFQLKTIHDFKDIFIVSRIRWISDCEYEIYDIKSDYLPPFINNETIYRYKIIDSDSTTYEVDIYENEEKVISGQKFKRIKDTIIGDFDNKLEEYYKIKQ